MAKTIELTDDVKQDEPLVYVVFCPKGFEFDYRYFGDRTEAENAADEYADYEGAEGWPIYPMYARPAIL